VTAALTRELNHTDLFGDLDQAAKFLDAYDDYRPYGDNTEFLVTAHDKFYTPIGEPADYISLSWDSPTNKVETATLVLKGNDPLNEQLMKCHQEVCPISIAVNNDPSMRVWHGRVDTFDDAIVDWKNTVTYQLIGDYNWSNKILCWPDFLLPIEAQWPHDALYIGPAVSCILTMYEEQIFRLQSGLWEWLNNLADPEAWAGIAGTFEMGGDLLTPLAVNSINSGYDTSKWVAFHGRMDNTNQLTEPILKDNGLHLSFDLWMPGEPQPLNDWASLGGLIQLTRPTIVVNCVDRSGLVGPTGSWVDGGIFDLVDLEQSIFGNLPGLGQSADTLYGWGVPEGLTIDPTLGINFVPPWTIFNADDAYNSGIVEMHFNGHHPLAYTVIGGGKSPKWMNDLINASLEYLMDMVMMALQFSGVPSDLLDGVFDDVLLAFQQVENFQRRLNLGPYGYFEFFTATGSSAFTFDEYMALRSAMWDTRGYISAQITVNNGYPYTLLKDIFKGQLASLVRRGKVYTDYIAQVSGKDDRTTRAQITYTLGDGSAQESPVAKLQRRIAGFEAAFNILTLSAN
jgi:hypothetical protein